MARRTSGAGVVATRGTACSTAILVGCTFVVGWLAWWIIDWDSGRSPAKSILHTRVVRADTRELPGFGRMALREVVGKAVPAGAGLLGLLMLGDGSSAARFLVAAALAWYAMSVVAALLDDQRRALWDMFAGTIVVLDPDVSPDCGGRYRADVKRPPPHSSFQIEPLAHRNGPVFGAVPADGFDERRDEVAVRAQHASRPSWRPLSSSSS